VCSPDTQQELLPQNCGSSFVKFNLRLLKSAKQEHTSFLIDRDHIRRHADHGTGSDLRFQMRYSSRDAVSIWFFLNRIQHAEILCGILWRRIFLISIGETTSSW